MAEKPNFDAELKVSDSSKFSIFEFDEAPKLMSSSALPILEATSPELGEIFRAKIDAGLDDGGYGKLLFNYGNEEDGQCLFYSWFKPGFVIPRHTHGQDCLYYIISGSAILGNRTLEAGDGFYVPAGKPYAYQAGPNGIEVLEFRKMLAQQTTATFLDTSEATWTKALNVVKDNHAAWLLEEVPPSMRSRTSESVVGGS
jgi:hypothetical protein